MYTSAPSTPQPSRLARGHRISRVALVVSADRELRAYVVRGLRSLGDRLCQIREAADGQAALESALRHKADVIVTDVMLPRLDGLALARRITAHHPPSRVVVMASARAEEREVIQGVSSWLEKPFDQRTLCRCVGPLLVSKRDETLGTRKHTL